MTQTQTQSVYEVMFLVSQASGATLGQTLEHIDGIIKHAGGEVVAMQKWDDRRLAYEIEKQKRGVYLLSYIRLAHDAIADLERSCNISETVMRYIIINADHLTEEEVASRDDREGLRAEAKLRAEEQPKEEEASGVALGRPEEKSPEAESQPEGDAEGQPETTAGSQAEGGDAAEAQASASDSDDKN
jgi:small subunit ribosomal protein S6